MPEDAPRPERTGTRRTAPVALPTDIPPEALRPWHSESPAVLIRALAAADAAAPNLATLARRWLPSMPRRPLASQSIRAITASKSSDPLLLDSAVTCPWVAVDGTAGINALLVDVDHPDVFEYLEGIRACGCPVPDIIGDPWSGRTHAVLWLLKSVATEGPRVSRKAIHATGFAVRLLAASLGGTALPGGSLIKSPWGLVSALQGQRLLRGEMPVVPDAWEAYVEAKTGLMWGTTPGTGPAHILDVISALRGRWEFDCAPESRRGAADDGGMHPYGRNCSLFDWLRKWAYPRLVADDGDLLRHALVLNGRFPVPLAPSEVAATARSVGRFMRHTYIPKHGMRARKKVSGPGCLRGHGEVFGGAAVRRRKENIGGQEGGYRWQGDRRRGGVSAVRGEVSGTEGGRGIPPDCRFRR